MNDLEDEDEDFEEYEEEEEEPHRNTSFNFLLAGGIAGVGKWTFCVCYLLAKLSFQFPGQQRRCSIV